MKPSWIVVVVGLAFAAGYLVNELTSEGAPPERSPREYRTPTAATAPQSISAPDAESPPEFSDLHSQADVFSTLHLAFEIAAEADLEKLKSLASEALRYEDTLFSFNIADIFVERMAAIDLNAALDYVESLPAGRNRHQLLASIYRTWLREDPDAAHAYADSVKDPGLQARLFAAEAQQESATSFGLRSPSGITFGRSGGISYSSPAANLSRQRDLRRSLREMQRGMQQDPEATIEGLLAEPQSPTRGRVLPQAMALLAQQDPDLALDYLSRFPSELRESEGAILSVLASQDPLAVAELTEDYARRTGDVGPLTMRMAVMMKEDADLALASYERVPEQFKPQVALSLGGQLIQQDPKAGLDWLLQQPLDSSSLETLLRMGGADTQAAAESLLYESTDSAVRQQLLGAMASSRSWNDPAATVAWLEQFEQEPGFEMHYHNAIVRWAGKDPAAAAVHLANNPQRDSSIAIDNIARNWARRDPDAAIAWAQTLSDPVQQQSANRELITFLVQYDPARAKGLYDSMPDGSAKYRAGVDMALQQARYNMPEATRIMEELGIPTDYIQRYAGGG